MDGSGYGHGSQRQNRDTKLLSVDSHREVYVILYYFFISSFHTRAIWDFGTNPVGQRLSAANDSPDISGDDQFRQSGQMQQQWGGQSEKTREEERRSEKRKAEEGRSRYMKSRKLRSTVFFQCFVAMESRKVGSPKRQMQSHLESGGE